MLVIIIVILNIIKVITQEELENHKYDKKINTNLSLKNKKDDSSKP